MQEQIITENPYLEKKPLKPISFVLEKLQTISITELCLDHELNQHFFKTLFYSDDFLEILDVFENYSLTISDVLVRSNTSEADSKKIVIAGDDLLDYLCVVMNYYLVTPDQAQKLFISLDLLMKYYSGHSIGALDYFASAIFSAVNYVIGEESQVLYNTYDLNQYESLLKSVLRLVMYEAKLFRIEKDEHGIKGLLFEKRKKLTRNGIEYLNQLELQIELYYLNINKMTLFNAAIKYEKNELLCYFLLCTLNPDDLNETITQIDSFGKTLYDYAVEKEYLKIIKLCQESGVGQLKEPSSPQRLELVRSRKIRSPFKQKIFEMPALPEADFMDKPASSIISELLDIFDDRIIYTLPLFNPEQRDFIASSVTNVGKLLQDCLFKLRYTLERNAPSDQLLKPIELYIHNNLSKPTEMTFLEFINKLDPLSRRLLQIYHHYQPNKLVHVSSLSNDSQILTHACFCFSQWNNTKRQLSFIGSNFFAHAAIRNPRKKLALRLLKYLIMQGFSAEVVQKAWNLLLLVSEVPGGDSKTRDIFKRSNVIYKNEKIDISVFNPLDDLSMWQFIDKNIIDGFADDFHVRLLCRLLQYDAHSGSKPGKTIQRTSYFWYKTMNKHPSPEKRSALQHCLASVFIRSPKIEVLLQLSLVLMSDMKMLKKPHGLELYKFLNQECTLLGLLTVIDKGQHLTMNIVPFLKSRLDEVHTERYLAELNEYASQYFIAGSIDEFLTNITHAYTVTNLINKTGDPDNDFDVSYAEMLVLYSIKKSDSSIEFKLPELEHPFVSIQQINQDQLVVIINPRHMGEKTEKILPMLRMTMRMYGYVCHELISSDDNLELSSSVTFGSSSA